MIVVTLVAVGDIGRALLCLLLLVVTAVAVFLPLVAVGLTVGASKINQNTLGLLAADSQ